MRSFHERAGHAGNRAGVHRRGQLTGQQTGSKRRGVAVLGVVVTGGGACMSSSSSPVLDSWPSSLLRVVVAVVVVVGGERRRSEELGEPRGLRPGRGRQSTRRANDVYHARPNLNPNLRHTHYIRI